MKITSILLALSFMVFLPACDSGIKPARDSVSIKVGKRSDGLFYAENAAEPYTGEVVGFSAKNTRQSIETYQNGQPHGSWKRFWSSGTLKREQIWDMGNNTHQRQWYEDGSLKEERHLRQGLEYGRLILYWPNGHLRRTAFVGNDLRPHGHILEYAEDGTVVVDAIYHHGQHISGFNRAPVHASAPAGAAEILANPTTAQAH